MHKHTSSCVYTNRNTPTAFRWLKSKGPCLPPVSARGALAPWLHLQPSPAPALLPMVCTHRGAPEVLPISLKCLEQQWPGQGQGTRQDLLSQKAMAIWVWSGVSPLVDGPPLTCVLGAGPVQQSQMSNGEPRLGLLHSTSTNQPHIHLLPGTQGFLPLVCSFSPVLFVPRTPELSRSCCEGLCNPFHIVSPAWPPGHCPQNCRQHLRWTGTMDVHSSVRTGCFILHFFPRSS